MGTVSSRRETTDGICQERKRPMRIVRLLFGSHSEAITLHILLILTHNRVRSLRRRRFMSRAVLEAGGRGQEGQFFFSVSIGTGVSTLYRMLTRVSVALFSKIIQSYRYRPIPFFGRDHSITCIRNNGTYFYSARFIDVKKSYKILIIFKIEHNVNIIHYQLLAKSSTFFVPGSTKPRNFARSYFLVFRSRIDRFAILIQLFCFVNIK